MLSNCPAPPMIHECLAGLARETSTRLYSGDHALSQGRWWDIPVARH